MRAAWLLVPLVFLPLSCGPVLTTGGRTFNLDSRHAPLTQIVENPAHTAGPTVATTVMNTVYVGNLSAFLQAYPPDSDRLEALLKHERVHAVHELEAFPFVDAWFGRYGADGHFRWSEEQQGFREEITYLIHKGYSIDPEEVARRLTANYRGLDGPMVGHDEALAWVEQTTAQAEGGSR